MSDDKVKWVYIIPIKTSKSHEQTPVFASMFNWVAEKCIGLESSIEYILETTSGKFHYMYIHTNWEHKIRPIKKDRVMHILRGKYGLQPIRKIPAEKNLRMYMMHIQSCVQRMKDSQTYLFSINSVPHRDIHIKEWNQCAIPMQFNIMIHRLVFGNGFRMVRNDIGIFTDTTVSSLYQRCTGDSYDVENEYFIHTTIIQWDPDGFSFIEFKDVFK
jgi:hypothetical protein